MQHVAPAGRRAPRCDGRGSGRRGDDPAASATRDARLPAAATAEARSRARRALVRPGPDRRPADPHPAPCPRARTAAGGRRAARQRLGGGQPRRGRRASAPPRRRHRIRRRHRQLPEGAGTPVPRAARRQRRGDPLGARPRGRARARPAPAGRRRRQCGRQPRRRRDGAARARRCPGGRYAGLPGARPLDERGHVHVVRHRVRARRGRHGLVLGPLRRRVASGRPAGVPTAGGVGRGPAADVRGHGRPRRAARRGEGLRSPADVSAPVGDEDVAVGQ